MDLSKISMLQSNCVPVFRGKRLMDLFYHTLSNSSTWDQALGYFRLSSYSLFAYPLAKFILKNNGVIRVFCNIELSIEDYNILSEAKRRDIVVDDLFTDLKSITSALENKNEKLFSDCIAFLIQKERFEIKVLIRRDNARGIAHEKTGIFKDNKGNIITISGSANASEQAYQFNREKMTAACSFWDEKAANNTIEDFVKDFDNVFTNGDEEWQILSIDSKELKAKLLEVGYREIDENDLYNDSRTFFERNKEIFTEEIQKEIELELANLEIESNSQPLPLPEKPANIPYFNFPFDKLYGYQEDAIAAWEGNGNQGILAMATGTGKTFTAFGAISKFLALNPVSIIFICCPYTHLVDQWARQIREYGAKPILVYKSKKTWLLQLDRRLQLMKHNKEPLFIIATNASLQSSTFLKIMANYWDLTFFIADEAHNLGSIQLRKCLPGMAKTRLGLSATIQRYFDDEGTQILINYFGRIVFERSLKEALGKDLTNYYYFAHPVEMTDEEFTEYISLSKKISKLSHNQSEEAEEKKESLLMKRARLQNNSINKIKWIKENVNYSPSLCHTLFYVGDKIFSDVLKVLTTEKKLIAEKFTKDTKNRQLILDQFDKKTIQALVAMKCLDEGVDVPATKTAYFLASSGNEKEFIQRRGRVLRKSTATGKLTAEIIDLISVPPSTFYADRNSDNYKICRDSMKREFKRVKEFADLAINKHASTIELNDVISNLQLLDQL